MYAASCSCTFLSTCVFHSDRLPPRAYTLSHTIAHAHILFNPQTYTDPGWKGRQDSRGGMEKRALLGVTVPLGIWVEWGNVVCLVGRARMARRCLCVAVCCSMVQYGAMCCSVLQCVAVCCSVLQCVAVVPQGNLVCLSARPAWHAGAWVLQSVVVCCSVSKCVKVVPLGSGVGFFGKARMVRRWCVCVAGGNRYLAATLDIGDEYSVEIVHSVSRRWSMVFCGNR